MARIEGSVVINRPVEEVFAFVTNPENERLWRSILLEWEQTSDGPMGVGTTIREVEQFLGRRIEETYEVTEYEPNRKFALKSISGPTPNKVSQTLESVQGGTKHTLLIEAELGGFFKLAEPIVARMIKKQVEAQLEILKGLLEAGAGATA
ncbi:MAG: SRPBCC family protein [Anaerolineae bacterium]